MSESLQDVLRRFGEQQMAAAQAAARSAGKALNATQADFVLSSEIHKISDTEAEEIRQRLMSVWVPQSEMWKFDKRYGEGSTD